MGDAIRSEWLKLRTTRATVVLLVLALLVPIALVILVTASVPLDTLPDDTIANRFSLTIAGAGLGDTLLAVTGVLAMSSEYRHNTIRVTIAAVPSRWRVLGAKIVVVAAVSIVIAAIAVTFSYVVGAAILGARAHGVSISDPGVARSIVGAVLLAVLEALIGLTVGTIIRATAGAVTLVVLWPVLIEPLLFALLPGVGKFLPYTAGSALQSPEGTKDVLSPLAGGVVIVAFTTVLLVAAGVLLQRRDA
jgi:ABC-2 type transport system permease protein